MATRPPAVARPHARVLADLRDAALAGDWGAGPAAALAVLSWHGPGDDDLELATKRFDGHPADQLDVFGPDHPCLAVALSCLEQPDVRVTVAFDEFDEVTMVRHRSGRTERPEVSDGPTAGLLRQSLSNLRFHSCPAASRPGVELPPQPRGEAANGPAGRCATLLPAGPCRPRPPAANE